MGIHDDLVRHYGWDKVDRFADDLNHKVFERALKENPEADILVIGPAPGLGKVAHLAKGKMTFQGGFLPYSMHMPMRPVPRFLGLDCCPTFNMNGARDAVDALLKAPLALRRFCGKNVCHAVFLDKEVATGLGEPKTVAGEVYNRAVKLYLERHDGKKMHDPTALACHFYPEIATWVRGYPVRHKDGWTTRLAEDGDYILADVDYDRLWEILLNRL